MTARAEPTVEHLVAHIAETVIERLNSQKRLGAPITFNEAARVLGEVINEMIDAGEIITDEVCKQLVGLPDVVDETPKTMAPTAAPKEDELS